MQISVIPADRTIVKNGEALVFDFFYYPQNLHALQWNGISGTMEFTGGASQWFDNPSMVKMYIDAYDAEAARVAQAEADAAAQAEADRIAAEEAAATT
jgi:hypothetical protein